MKSVILSVALAILLLVSVTITANAQISVFQFPIHTVKNFITHNQTITPPPLHTINPPTTTQTTNELNVTSLQQQINNLQSKLANVKSLVSIQQHIKEQQMLQPIVAYDDMKNCAKDQHMPENTTDWYKTYLTDFRCGHVHVAVNGTVYRSFTLISDDYQHTGKPWAITTNKTNPVYFHAWTFNGTVPGPTMRMTVGDHVSINLYNAKDSAMAHGMHMHSIHSGFNDGVPGISPGGLIFPGGNFTFNFIANPVGVFPYHCHMPPVVEHIGRGLFGMIIIDPKTPRDSAKEMVMMLNGYSFSSQGLDGKGVFNPSIPCTAEQMRTNLTKCEDLASENHEGDNQFYTVNGMAFGYDPMDSGNLGTSIHLNTDQRYRIYLVNMLELDPVNNFHIHGTMFYYTSSGTFNVSPIYTDIVTLMQGDRGILQFTYPFPGEFMFHSHHNHFSELGWIGFFEVNNDRSYSFFR